MNDPSMTTELAAVRELDRLWVAVAETGDQEARDQYRALRPLVWAAVTRPVMIETKEAAA